MLCAPNRRAVLVGARRGFGDGGGEALEALVLVEGLFVERSGTGAVNAADGLGEQDGGVGRAADGGGAAGVGESELFAGGLLDQGEGETVQAGAGLAEAQGFGTDLGVELAAGAVGQERVLAWDGGEAALGHAGDEDGVEAESSGCAGGVADQDALERAARSEAGLDERAAGGAEQAGGGVARADSVDAAEIVERGADRIDQVAVVVGRVFSCVGVRPASAVVDVVVERVEHDLDGFGPGFGLRNLVGARLQVIADRQQFAGGLLVVEAFGVAALERVEVLFEVGVELGPVAGQAGAAGDAFPLERLGARSYGEARAEGGVAEEFEQLGALGFVAEQFEQSEGGASGVGVEDGLSAGDECGDVGASERIGEAGVACRSGAVEDRHFVELDATCGGVEDAAGSFGGFGAGIGGGEAGGGGRGGLGGLGRARLGVGFGLESVGESGGVVVAVGRGDQHVDGDLRGAEGEQLALDAGEVVHASDDQRRAAERGRNVVGLDGLGERVFVEGGAVAELGGAVAPGGIERSEVGDDSAVVGRGGAVVGEAGERFGVDAALAEIGEGDVQGFGEAGGVGVEFAELTGGGAFADDVVEQERGSAGRERGALGQVGAVGDFAGEVGGGEEVDGGERADLAGEAALVVEALEAGADEDVDAGERLAVAPLTELRLEAALGGGDVAAALNGQGHRERVARERVCVDGAAAGRALDGGGAALAGADADGVFDGEDEDFAVADLAGAGVLEDRVDHGVQRGGVDHDLDADFGQVVDLHLLSAVLLDHAALRAAAANFGDRHADDADLFESVADDRESFGSDDGDDHLHGMSLSVAGAAGVGRPRAGFPRGEASRRRWRVRERATPRERRLRSRCPARRWGTRGKRRCRAPGHRGRRALRLR